MVTIQMLDTGDLLDTLGVKITYVKQAADVGDITKMNTSYSWSFTIPKTHKNTMIFKGLGMIGDLSNAPYIKRYCAIQDNGIQLVEKGLLKIQETTNEYKAFVQDGIVEFYNDVKVDTLAEALDLSDIRHQSTITEMINSQTNPDYRYIVADYGYQRQADHLGATNLRQAGMVPSVNFKYLWNKIFTHYGWTYSGNFDLSDTWLSYPSTKELETTQGTQILFISYPNQNLDAPQGTGYLDVPNGTPTVNGTYVEQLTSTSWRVLQDGTYLINMFATGEYHYYERTEGWFQEDYLFRMYVDGLPVAYDESGDLDPSEATLILEQNQVIEFKVREAQEGDEWDAYYDFDAGMQIALYLASVSEINWEVALIKFKVKDFIKEAMIRKGLVSFADVPSKHIHFMTLDERLNADIIDWSDKYVMRKSEKYVYNSYAQKNYIRHKYIEENQDYGDGVLAVWNENLPVEKDLYVSKTYAPLEESSIFTNQAEDFYVRRFQMWETETKKNESDVIETEYKSVSNRFFVIETKPLINDGIYIDTILMASYTPSKLYTQMFWNVVDTHYDLIKRVIDKSRIHNIELLVSKADMAALDLQKKYYFEQENQVYLLNKLTWKEGETVIGEFIRVNL